MIVRRGIGLALAVVFGLGAGVALSAAARRPAQAILSEHDALALPGGFLDEAGLKRLLEVCRRRAELDQELFDTWPSHPRAASALDERWAFLENTFHEHQRVLAETEQVLAHGIPARLALVARRARAWSSVNSEQVAPEECVRRIDAARPGGREDDRAAAMLVELAACRSADCGLQARLCHRVLGAEQLAPESRQAAQEWLRLVERAGQPLALGFDDARSGAPASIAAWKGSPVLVHVRRASDSQPLEERDLRAIEERHPARGLVVVEIVIGRPDKPRERRDRSFVAPDEWDTCFGIRKTPLFLLADAAGSLIGVSQALAPLERELDALRQ